MTNYEPPMIEHTVQTWNDGRYSRLFMSERTGCSLPELADLFSMPFLTFARLWSGSPRPADTLPGLGLHRCKSAHGHAQSNLIYCVNETFLLAWLREIHGVPDTTPDESVLEVCRTLAALRAMGGP